MRLGYWCRTGLRTLLTALAASVLYAVIMYIQLEDGYGQVMPMMITMLLLFGAAMVLSMNLAVYKFNVPLALSFGSTRREAMLGLLVHRLIPILGIPAVTALLAFATGHFLPLSLLIPLSLGLFLLAGAIGSGLGMVYTKWGKVAAILSVVLVFLLAGGTGMAAALLSDDALSVLTSYAPLCWAAPCIGLLVSGLVLIAEYRTVQNIQVKL